LPRTTSYRWHLTTYPEAMPISCAGLGSFARYSRPRRSSMRPSSDTGPARHPFWASLAHDPDRICAAVLGYRHYCRDCLARAHARYLAARRKRPSGSRSRNEGRLRAIKASRLSARATGWLRRLGREILGFPAPKRGSSEPSSRTRCLCKAKMTHPTTMPTQPPAAISTEDGRRDANVPRPNVLLEKS
jgi:hypothetical protein